jgi:hypothetical protein
MPIDWLRLRADTIEALEHGVDATDHFETTFVGDETFEHIEYPAAQVYPVNTTRSDGNKYEHRTEVSLIFRRDRGDDYIEDILHPMAHVIRESLAALSQTESLVEYYPNEIEDFVGELGGTGVVVLTIRWVTTTAADFAETSPNDYA